jgi:hypothetical protein
VLAYDTDKDDPGWDILKLPGYTSMPQTSTMGFFGSGSTYTFKVGSTDLGGATEFDFYVTTGSLGGDPATVRDDAPDSGLWSYTLKSVKPVIGAPTISPATPVVGKQLTVTLPVTRSDGAKLIGGTLSFDLTLDGRVIAHSEKLKGGVASLRVKVPASAKGKLLTARVAVTGWW